MKDDEITEKDIMQAEFDYESKREDEQIKYMERGKNGRKYF